MGRARRTGLDLGGGLGRGGACRRGLVRVGRPGLRGRGRTRGTLEEAKGRAFTVGQGHFHLGCQDRGRVDDLDLLLAHVEGEQIEQVGVAGRGERAEDAPVFLVAGQGADLAQARDVAEQLGDAVGVARVFQRADVDLQLACGRGGLACRGGGRCECDDGSGGDRSGRGRHRGGRGHRFELGLVLALCQHGDAGHQRVGRRGIGAAALVARQQQAQRVRRFEQHVHHRRVGLEFVAAQLVQQRLHLVREFGHVGEAEGGATALDGMGAAEDRVELLVVGLLHVQLQQHLLHLVQVFAGLFKKDLVELAQIDVVTEMLAVVHHFTHGGLLACVACVLVGRPFSG